MTSQALAVEEIFEERKKNFCRLGDQRDFIQVAEIKIN